MIFTIHSKKYGDHEVIIDDEDAERVLKYKWHVGKFSEKFYAMRLVKEKDKTTSDRLHRFIMNYPNSFVDHINNNSLDNRKQNLRICNMAENCRNQKRHKDNISGYKGVDFSNNKWKARIRFNYKSIYLGYYETKEQAAIAYNIAALKYFGEFAQLNNIWKDNRYE